MASNEHDAAAELVRSLLESLGDDPSPTARREMWDSHYGALPLADHVACRADEAGGVPVEWLTPSGAGSVVVQYHHGGGYSAGSLTMHRHLASRLAAASGSTVVNVGYRLAPEHRFPAAVEDAVAVYRSLLDTGHAADRIVVAGDSAGGGLAAGAIAAIRDAALPLPAGLVVIAPLVDARPATPPALDATAISSGDAGDDTSTPEPTDAGEQRRGVNGADGASQDMFVSHRRTASIVVDYLGDHDPAHPYVSPLLADLDGYPPVYVQVSESEALYDQAVAFVDGVRRRGGDATLDAVPGLMHTWQLLAPEAPETDDAIRRLAGFVRRFEPGAGTTPSSERPPDSGL